MTRTEDRLRALLREITPEPVADVRYQAVVDLVRERRKARSTRMAAVAAVVVVLCGGGAVVVDRAMQPAPAGGALRHASAVPTPTPTPASIFPPNPISRSGSVVVFEGVSVRVPAGWSVGTTAMCGLTSDKTVGLPLPYEFVASCPMSNDPVPVPRSLTLQRMTTWDSPDGWGATSTIWHGQPASFAFDSYLGATRVYLALPWLNTVVESTAADRAQALAQLAAVTPRPGTGLDVPVRADAIEVVSYTPAGIPGFTHRGHVTRPQDVAALLADLRGGVPVSASGAACPETATAETAVLTVRTGEAFRTFRSVLGTCDVVTSNTGFATKVGARLSQDVARLAVDPPPTSQEVAGGCTSTGSVALPAGSVGAVTRQAVLGAFLAGRPAGYPPDPQSWVEVDAGVFISGSAQVVAAPVGGSGRGYYLAFEMNC